MSRTCVTYVPGLYTPTMERGFYASELDYGKVSYGKLQVAFELPLQL